MIFCFSLLFVLDQSAFLMKFSWWFFIQVSLPLCFNTETQSKVPELKRSLSWSSTWVETGVFPWRVGGGKLFGRVFLLCAFWAMRLATVSTRVPLQLWPFCFVLRSKCVSAYADAIKERGSSDDIVMCLLPDDRKDRYDQIKQQTTKAGQGGWWQLFLYTYIVHGAWFGEKRCLLTEFWPLAAGDEFSPLTS